MRKIVKRKIEVTPDNTIFYECVNEVDDKIVRTYFEHKDDADKFISGLKGWYKLHEINFINKPYKSLLIDALNNIFTVSFRKTIEEGKQ